MLYFFLWVDQFEYKIGVLRYSSGPEDRFALLFEVAEKVIEIFAFINAQQGIIRVKFLVKVVRTHRGEEVAFLIWGESVHEKLIHFHDNSELAVIFFGRKEAWFGLVILEDVFDDGAKVILCLEFLFEEL
jgi:hypothetical protein